MAATMIPLRFIWKRGSSLLVMLRGVIIMLASLTLFLFLCLQTTAFIAAFTGQEVKLDLIEEEAFFIENTDSQQQVMHLKTLDNTDLYIGEIHEERFRRHVLSPGGENSANGEVNIYENDYGDHSDNSKLGNHVSVDNPRNNIEQKDSVKNKPYSYILTTLVSKVDKKRVKHEPYEYVNKLDNQDRSMIHQRIEEQESQEDESLIPTITPDMKPRSQTALKVNSRYAIARSKNSRNPAWSDAHRLEQQQQENIQLYPEVKVYDPKYPAKHLQNAQRKHKHRPRTVPVATEAETQQDTSEVELHNLDNRTSEEWDANDDWMEEHLIPSKH